MGPPDPDRLCGLLDDHRARFADGTKRHEFVDHETADDLRGRLAAQLDRWSELDDDQRETLAGAVEYLARIDDEEDDLASPIGLDDDAEVVEAALRKISWPGMDSERPSA